MNNLVVIEDYEVMSDEPDKAHRFKTVIHQKRRKSITVGSGNVYSIAGSGSFADASNVAGSYWTTWWGQNFEFLRFSDILTSFDKSDDTLMREAMDAFYNVNEVDSLLNVVEAPELMPSIRSLYDKIRGFQFADLRRVTKRDIKSMFRKFPVFVSGGYLYYSFGIAPLISDMNKISKNLGLYKQRLRNNLKHAGRSVSVHKGCSGQFVAISRPSTANGLPPGYATGHDLGGSFTAHPYLLEAKKVYTVRGKRDVRYGSESFQTLDHLASRFGSVGPASFLWERIPFSFVVDWFLDLSGVFNSLDNALTGNTKKIEGGSVSEKWRYLLPIFHVRPNSGFTSDRDGSQIALIELSSYIRKSTMPAVSVGLSGRFGKKQASLTAALLTQMGASLARNR
jgi:hypothetical protein